MVLLSLVTSGKAVVDILEQPMTSLMDKDKRIGSMQLEEVHTWLGIFGAPTAKPTKLMSKHLEITIGLKRKMGKSEKDRFAAEAPPTTYAYWKDGRIKVQPIVGNMRKSQQYSVKYAEEVVTRYCGWRRRQEPVDADSSDSDYDPSLCPASWPEAGLRPLAKRLCKRHPNMVGHF